MSKMQKTRTSLNTLSITSRHVTAYAGKAAKHGGHVGHEVLQEVNFEERPHIILRLSHAQEEGPQTAQHHTRRRGAEESAVQNEDSLHHNHYSAPSA